MALPDELVELLSLNIAVVRTLPNVIAGISFNEYGFNEYGIDLWSSPESRAVSPERGRVAPR